MSTEVLETVYVPGLCPMGCGKTLVARRRSALYGRVEYVIECREGHCPDRNMAQKLLSDEEAADHIVWLLENGRFHLKHPLRERLNRDLVTCSLHRELTEGPLRSRTPGRYRVLPGRNDTGWTWEKLVDLA